jgi:hypothetical protein
LDRAVDRRIKRPASFVIVGQWFGSVFARTALVLRMVHGFDVGPCPNAVKNGLFMSAD